MNLFLLAALALSPQQPLPQVQESDFDAFYPATVSSKAGFNSWMIRDYQEYLLSQEWDTAGRHEEWQAELDYCKFCYRSWDILDDLIIYEKKENAVAIDLINQKLTDLRNLLGPENYYSGYMPPPPNGAYAFSKWPKEVAPMPRQD